MTTLEGCQLILAKAGQPSPTQLDPEGPGSTSDVAEAQFVLERETKNVLARGWSQNIEESVTVYPPTDRIVVTGAGILIVGEQLAEGVTAAYGLLQAIVVEGADTVAYITRQSSVAFTGGQTLTGDRSGNSRAGGARTAITDQKIRVGTDWIETRQADDEVKELTTNAGFLYDMNNRRFTFTGPVKLRIVLNKPIDSLSHKLGRLCAIVAAKEFQVEKKAGVRDDAWIRDNLITATNDAEDEDRTQARHNTFNTNSAWRMSGRRRPSGWNEGERYA